MIINSNKPSINKKAIATFALDVKVLIIYFIKTFSNQKQFNLLRYRCVLWLLIRTNPYKQIITIAPFALDVKV